MWYAAQVCSNSEGRVSDVLTERHLQNFWPHSQRQDRWKRIFRKAYFPGYVFFEAELTREAHQQVISVPKVVRIVGHGSDPEPIPDGQIRSVRTVAELEAKLKLAVEYCPARAFSGGQKIIVACGPLKGVEGYVTYVKNKMRLVIQVEMLGQAVSVELDATWLKRAA